MMVYRAFGLNAGRAVVADMTTDSRSAIRGDFCDVDGLVGMGGGRRKKEEHGG
jgi:hypothetical protein